MRGHAAQHGSDRALGADVQAAAPARPRQQGGVEHVARAPAAPRHGVRRRRHARTCPRRRLDRPRIDDPPHDPPAPSHQPAQHVLGGGRASEAAEVIGDDVRLGGVHQAPRDRAAHMQPPGRRHRPQRIPQGHRGAGLSRRHQAGLVDHHQRPQTHLHQTTHLLVHRRRQAPGDLTRESLQITGPMRQRHGQRERPGDLELDDAVRRRPGGQLEDEVIPRGWQLPVTVGRPATALGIGAEPLLDHVPVGPRELRAERQRVGADRVAGRLAGVGERQAADSRGGQRRQPRQHRAHRRLLCRRPRRGAALPVRRTCSGGEVDRSSGSDVWGRVAFPDRGPVAVTGPTSLPLRVSSGFRPDSLTPGRGANRLRRTP